MMKYAMPTRAELQAWGMVLLGLGVAILYIGVGSSFWSAHYIRGVVLLLVAVGLTITIFRNWLRDLLLCGLVFVPATTGLGTLAKPSILGLFVKIGAFLSIYVIVRRAGRTDQ